MLLKWRSQSLGSPVAQRHLSFPRKRESSFFALDPCLRRGDIVDCLLSAAATMVFGSKAIKRLVTR